MNCSVAFIQAFVAAALGVNLACAQTSGGFSRPADKPVPRTDRNSQIAHEQLIEKAKKGGIDVYFLGDSITRRWGATDYPEFLASWRSNFFGWNAANFGWGADQIENILWRVENGELDGVNPKVIVLLAGINNVGTIPGGDAKVENITRGLEALVNVCRQKAPNAIIILTAIFPRNDNVAVIPTINRINDNLAKMADGKKIRCLNVNDKLADKDGKLFDGISTDTALGTIRSLEANVQGFEERASKLEYDIADANKRAKELETKVGAHFEREERYQQLTLRQSEIEEKLDLNKNQAPSQVEAASVDESEEKNSKKQDKTNAVRPKQRMKLSA